MKKLICHGDSLTEGSDLERSATWPSQVARRLNISVINSGIGGDTTGGLLSRFYPDVVDHHPDGVLIMGGTNDLWWDLDLKWIRAHIFTMTCQAEHHGIIPLVGLPPPIIAAKARRQDIAEPEGGYDLFVTHLNTLVSALALAAGQNDVTCLDFYRPFIDAAGNPIEKYFLDDGLHPNETG
ncbi:MAG: GDSL-type esterase/lipase family protein, partial [Desulfobacterales bacterium]|nr:GDSL-type esterase/lipase family protein [Desulfobacterales bacterium]